MKVHNVSPPEESPSEAFDWIMGGEIPAKTT